MKEKVNKILQNGWKEVEEVEEVEKEGKEEGGTNQL
jgi:hypothetical protein